MTLYMPSVLCSLRVKNEDGYNESAPINRVGDMDCRLLLMHGTADDNVHLMNTLRYVSALQSEGKICDMFLFLT